MTPLQKKGLLLIVPSDNTEDDVRDNTEFDETVAMCLQELNCRATELMADEEFRKDKADLTMPFELVAEIRVVAQCATNADANSKRVSIITNPFYLFRS